MPRYVGLHIVRFQGEEDVNGASQTVIHVGAKVYVIKVALEELQMTAHK